MAINSDSKVQHLVPSIVVVVALIRILAVVLVVLLKARSKVIEAISLGNVGESLDIYIEQPDVLECCRVAR